MMFPGARNAASYYRDFSPPRDTKADYEQGVTDGQADLPRSDQPTLGIFELAIIHEGLADLAKLQTNHSGDKQVLGANTALHMQARLDEYESEGREIGLRHDQAKTDLERHLGDLSRLAQDQELAAFEAEERFKDLHRELDREPLVRMVAPRIPLLPISLAPRFRHAYITPYAIYLLIISTIEMFINKGVIHDLLGGRTPEWAAIVVTSILGVVLVVFGHLVGMFIRQAKVVRRPTEWLRVFVGIPLLLAVVFASLYELAVIRQVYLGLGSTVRTLQANLESIGTAASQGGGSLQGALASAGTTAIQGALARMAELRGIFDPFQPLDSRALMFLLLNILVFTAGAFLSYRRHDPHPDFEELADEHMRANRAIAERRAKFDSDIADLESNYQRRRDAANKRKDKLAKRIAVYTRSAWAGSSQMANIRDQIVAVTTERVLAYQSGNSRARRTEAPSYFGADTVAAIRRMMGCEGLPSAQARSDTVNA